MNKFIKYFILLISVAFVLSCKKSNQSENYCLFSGCSDISFTIYDKVPVFSPDGKFIAYQHIDKEIGKTGIYILSVNNKSTMLWYSSDYIEDISWSSDGKWLSFSDHGQIWKKMLKGDSLMQVTTIGNNVNCSWSPDGRSISYNQTICNGKNTCGLWILDTQTFDTRFILPYTLYPYWNSNNQIFYFTTETQSGGKVTGDTLWYYNPSILQKKIVTVVNGINNDNRYSRLSPNGKSIIFLSKPNNKNLPQLWIMDVSGENKKQLTIDGSYAGAWSPDGKQIVYTNTGGNDGKLWLMNTDGSNRHKIQY